MKIRPKLLISFLSLCLIPLVLGTIYITYNANKSLVEKITDHLESVASIQKTKLQSALDKHLDRLALVSSRTQLRISITNYINTGQVSEQVRIRKILNDAKGAISDFESITILDLNGNLLVSTGFDDSNGYQVHEECYLKGKQFAGIGFISKGLDDALRAHLFGPLKLNDDIIAVIVVNTKIPEIISIVQDYTGLNETGETVIAKRSPEGDALFISPLRFDADAAFSRRESRNNLELPMTQALLKNETLLTSAFDYRGAEVVAATLYIPEADWGLVVKMDKTEAFKPIREMEKLIFFIIILTALLIFIISYFLSRSITDPLKQLNKTAADLSFGNWASRAEIRSKDEIGSLAQSFNVMAENLTSANTELEQKVAERTKDLEQEIQEQIKTEDALSEITERNKALLAAVPDIIMEVDGDKVYTWANPAGYDFFGDDVLGKEASNYFEGEQETYNSVQPLFNGTSRELIYVESWQRRRDGEIRLLAWWCRTLKDADGNSIGALSSAHDITEQVRDRKALQKSEQRFRDLTENTSDWIWEVDAEGAYTYVGPGVAALTGYTPKEILGKTPFDLMSKTEAKRVSKIFSSVLKSRKPIENLENVLLHKQGKELIVETNAIPFYDSDGNFAGYRGIDRNITERKQAKDALEHSHELMHYVIEHNRSAVAVHDRDMKYVYVSQRYLDDYNVKEQDVIGKHHYDVFPDLPQKWRDVHQKALAGETSGADDDPYEREDGSVEWTRWECRPWYEADGTVGGIIVYTEVITERKRAEEALRESKIFNETLLNTSPDIIYIYDLIERKNVYSNQGIMNVLGYSIKEIKTMGENILSDLMHPDDFEIYLNETVLRYPAAKDNQLIEHEYRMRHKDSTWRWLLCKESIFMRQDDGTPKQIFGVVSDITDRKIAEQELQQMANEIQSIFRSAPIGIGMVSNRLIQQVNKRFCEMVGYSEKELIGQNARIVYPSQEIYEWVGKEKYEQISKKGTGTVETQFQRKDGAIIDVLMSSTPLDLSDLSIGVTFSALEITDRKKTEQELEKYREHLEELVEERTVLLEMSNKDLKEFAYVVSHDLKAPLRAISQLAYWISTDYEDVFDAEGKEQLALLGSRVRRMDGLIDGILQYSRAGKITQKEKTIYLNSLVKDVIASLEVPENINIKIDNTLPKYVGDKTRIGQLFQNLISNSIKYMDKPKGKINISCIEDGDYWQFRVQDNGPGIEKKYFDKVFQIFQTLKPRDEQEGTGVGLTLVKKIVTIYKGEVWLESKVGEGLTVVFTLPKKQ